MNENKRLGIFALILLFAVLCIVIVSRSRQDSAVAIDGGLAVPEETQKQEIETTSEPTEPADTPRPTPTLPDIDISSWELVLVNKDNKNAGMPDVSEIGRSGAYFNANAIDALNSMISACRKAGFSPYINLAYVPYSSQEYYFNSKAREIAGSETVTEEDQNKAARIVARPGFSEHETGLAVDITDHFYSPYTNEDISTDLLSWLKDHCAEYGFIQRYPANKENITGCVEAYHFRYVGTEAAEYIMSHGMSLEEFIVLMK